MTRAREGMLTRERYTEIIGPASAGDRRAADELIRAYRPLVMSIVRPFVGRNGAELEDLVQEGLIGLMIALNRFDPTRGVGFHTYSSWWVRARAQAWVRGNITVGKLASRSERFITSRLFSTRRELEQRLGRQVELSELADALGVPLEVVEDYYSKLTPTAPVVEERVDGPGYTLATGGADPEAMAELHETLASVREVVERLDERARAMLERRLAGETMEEISADYGLSRERVRQITAKALGQIREHVPGV